MAAGRQLDPGPAALLPPELYPLIGREREIVALKSALTQPEARLLTVTGPGGVGKTSLALRVAAEVAGDFCDGAAIARMGSVVDRALVLPAFADALGLRDSMQDATLDLLRNYLARRQLLFFIDSFEHLLPSAPQIGALLASCPGLKVLVTSRERLHLAGEQELPLAPLAHEPAVALFVKRARAVRPDFAVTPDTTAAVAEICLKLDGLPLALELAAARIKLLPPEALLPRLDARLRLLTGGAADMLDRQQTLRATIDWSYGLLVTAERQLFQQLSVFVGGCTLEAAREVCQLEEGDQDLEDVAGSLIDKSLVFQQEAGGEPRLGMLETIREYAAERLAASGVEPALRGRHAAHFLALSGGRPALPKNNSVVGVLPKDAHHPLGYGERLLSYYSLIEREHDNIREALRWTIAQGDGATALLFGRWLWSFWHNRSYFSEGRVWLNRILEMSTNGEDVGVARAVCTGAAGMLAHRQGDFATAEVLYRRALALFQEMPTMPRVQSELSWLLSRLGELARTRGDCAGARDFLEEGLALCRSVHDRHYEGMNLVWLAHTSSDEGDFDSALAQGREALAAFTEVDFPRGLGLAQWTLGDINLWRGDYPAAQAHYSESLAKWRAIGDRGRRADVVGSLGWLAILQGDLTISREHITDSLTNRYELGDRIGVARGLEVAGAVAAGLARPVEALRAVAAASKLRAELGAPASANIKAALERHLAPARQALADHGVEAWNSGLALAPEVVVAETLEALKETSEPDQSTTAEDRPDDLTEREVEVLRFVAAGDSNDDIARALVLSVRTVERHITNIYGKIGARGRADATAYALRHGLA